MFLKRRYSLSKIKENAAPTIIWAIKLFSLGSGNNCLSQNNYLHMPWKQTVFLHTTWLATGSSEMISKYHSPPSSQRDKMHIKDFTSGHFFGILIDWNKLIILVSGVSQSSQRDKIAYQKFYFCFLVSLWSILKQVFSVSMKGVDIYFASS